MSKTQYNTKIKLNHSHCHPRLACLLDHTDSITAFWYTRSTFNSNGTLGLHCRIVLQRQLQYFLCGAYVGFIEHMRQTVCVDGLT